MNDPTITIDTDDFILEMSKSEYKKMKKICKELKISLNYFIHEFDINVEAEWKSLLFPESSVGFVLKPL